MLLWIDENVSIEYKKPEDLASAYYPLSKASIFLGRVRRRQHYRFWSYANDLMTAGVALSKSGSYRGYTKYQFPKWLTKMSRTRGTRSIQKSINEKLSTHCHTSRYVAQVEIFPFYSYLFKNEDKFNIHQIRELEFDAEEIGFLLGEDSDSAIVRQLVEKSKSKESTRKEEEDKKTPQKLEKKDEIGPKDSSQKDETEQKREPELQQKNLTDF